MLRLALKGAGSSALYEADRGDDGRALVLHEQPALVLLDLMLPGLDGLSVCREIRRSETVSTTPIIMLTAKSAESDIVAGLELGSEFDLLDILSGQPGRVYTRPQIIANIQGDDKAVTNRTVDTMMVGLRGRVPEVRPARHGAVPVHRADAHNAIRLRDASCPCSYECQGRFRSGSPFSKILFTRFTFSTIWKSNMPTQMASAPLLNAYGKPSRGWMAPAPSTLNAIHGCFTVGM